METFSRPIEEGNFLTIKEQPNKGSPLVKKKELINKYQITDNDIERTRALAYIMVRKWEPGLVTFDDVLGDGLEGLVHAAQLFDETLGKHFWAYATPTVRGYMLNGFRRRFGEKKQKMALARAESLSITEDDDPNFKPLEVEVEDNTQTSGAGLWDKINKLNLSPLQKHVMWLMSEGYAQADIARLMGKSDGSIANSVLAIRLRFSKEELVDLIAV